MRTLSRSAGRLLMAGLFMSPAAHAQDDLPAPELDKPAAPETQPASREAEPARSGGPGDAAETSGNDAGPVRAQLKPARWTVLAAGRAGRLKRLDADIGDRLDADATVAVFDCGELRARRAKAEARLQGAQRQLEVYEELDALKSVGRLKVRKTRTDVQLAEAQLGIIRARLTTCRITAPYAAEVVERRVEPHQFVAEGTELVKLVDNTSLRMAAVVNSRWLSWLDSGTRFRLELDELDRTLTGTVARLGGEADPVSQTVKIIGTIPDLPADTIAGMSGDVWFDRSGQQR